MPAKFRRRGKQKARRAAESGPTRLRILAALSVRQAYVSELARELKIGRPLLHMHLQTLEKAGLVVGRHEVSADGKALRYYEVTDFDERLTPERIIKAEKGKSGEQYRALAAAYEGLAKETRDGQKAMQADLAELRKRAESIERMMREVG